MTLHDGVMDDDEEDCTRLSDEQLLASLKACVADERRQTVRVLRRISEVERRNLHRKKRYASLFAFCVGELGYLEGPAARRIHAARAAKDHPIIYRRLSSGSISLTAVSLLAPHLNAENHRALLDKCAGKSSREIDRVLAELAPRPMRRDTVRHLGRPRGPAAVAALPPPEERGEIFASVPEPVGAGSGDACRTPAAAERERGRPEPELVAVSFAASQGFLERLELARQLLRHKYPAGRFEQVLTDALEALLERLDPIRRHARRTGMPARGPSEAAGGRRIPAGVRDAVWSRDGRRCAFVDDEGRRCESRDFLEIDHVVPYALGGASDDARNLRLLCRAHNQEEACRLFGEEWISRRARAGGGG